MMKKNLPELRFPKFEGEWEETKLGDISNFSKGKGISKKDIVDDGETECIRYGELYTKYTGEVIDEVYSRTNLPLKDLVLSVANDVIIPASGETQIDISTASCVLKSGIALGGDLNIIKTENNGVFLSYYLNNRKKLDIANLAQGISIAHLYSSQLALLKLNIPTILEQQKIAEFLSAVDNKINQLKEKKRLLEQYKKGVMQKIFSQEIRFKDENGRKFPKWEEKSFGEVAKFIKGKGLSKSDISENGKTECIRYGELYTHYKEVITKIYSRTNLNTDKLVLSEINDVIIPASGETQIDIATASCVMKKGIALGGDLNIIRTKNNGVFLSYYLNNIKKLDIARLSQGISVVHLYPSQLALLSIELPCIMEQNIIANFLSTLDVKKNLVNEQIEKAELWKKGLLQKMFC